MTLIGCRCKCSNVFSRAVLISQECFIPSSPSPSGMWEEDKKKRHIVLFSMRVTDMDSQERTTTVGLSSNTLEASQDKAYTPSESSKAAQRDFHREMMRRS